MATHVLRITHTVPDFHEWKQMFDSDPLDREGSGVRRFRVERAVDDPNVVFGDLEFDSLDEAEQMLVKLRALWDRTDSISDASGRIVELVEVGTPSHVGV
jgi:hypothetical protein